MKHQFLIFEQDSYPSHCRLIHEGIRKYFSEGDHQLAFLPLGFAELDNLQRIDSEPSIAIICWLDFEMSVAQIKALGVPYLNLRESDEMSNLDLRVAFEGEGRLGAEFFADEMGYESLAFVGMTNKYSHQRRFQEFQHEAKLRQLKVQPHWVSPIRSKSIDSSGSPFEYNRNLAEERKAGLPRFLDKIPKPAGILCGDDGLALNLYYQAQYLGIQVPEEVSILGVGSHKQTEEGGTQAVSVVQMDHVRQGYVAAKLLEETLSGKRTQKSVTLLPDGIVHRSTTTRRAFKDPLVRKVFELIDEDRSLTVSDLCKQLSVARRTLESRFRTVTNLGIAKAIDYERFHYAKQLLKSNRYSHDAIAGLAGYRNHRQMLRSFDRFVQMSPKQYKKTYLYNK